jgi:hypothetical protein
MTTAALSTALVMIQPAFTDAERLALAGFLAGYRGLTREAYMLDLRQSLVLAWACADTGESVPVSGRTSRGRAVVAGAVPAPRYGGPLRVTRDTDAAYGSRIAECRGTPYRGLFASGQAGPRRRFAPG